MRTTIRVCVTILSLFTGIFLLLLSNNVFAATEKPSFTITPVSQNTGYYIISSKSGSTITEQFKVSNTGTASGSAVVTATNAITDPMGGLSYYDITSSSKGVGNWMKLSQSKFTLTPGKSEIASFTIQVPNTVTVGPHVGGLTLTDTTSVQGVNQTANAKNSAAININLVTHVTRAVEIDIAGSALYKLSASDVTSDAQPSVQQILTTLTNQGNQYIRPSGTIQISQGGRTLISQPVKIGIFLPGDTIKYPLFLAKGLGAGTYTENIVLSYGDKGQYTLKYSKDFSVTSKQVSVVKSQPGNGTLFSNDSEMSIIILFITIGILGIGMIGMLFFFVILPRIKKIRKI